MSSFLPSPDNFLALPADQSNPETAQVLVLPVPFEQTTTFGKGAAHGPQAILDASHQVEFFDAELGFAPVERAGGIATQEPLPVMGCDGASVAKCLEQVVSATLARGQFVVTLGGEHSSIVGAVRAHCAAFGDVSVLQLDAHSDLRPVYEGSPWNHACAMARVLDFHDTLVQVGIRSQEADERRTSEALGLPVLYAHEIHEADERGDDWIHRVVAALRPLVYLTFDCDVLDPSVMPATGTPEPGGLSWRQVNRLLARLCRQRKIIGADFCELAPIPGMLHPQFSMAKLIYRLIGWRAVP